MPGPVRWVRYTGHPGSLAELASPTRGQLASGGWFWDVLGLHLLLFYHNP